MLVGLGDGADEGFVSLYASSHQRSHVESARYLLQLQAVAAGAEASEHSQPQVVLSGETQDGNTCLHLAAEKGDVETVRKLFEYPSLAITLKNQVGDGNIPIALLAGAC